MPAIGGSRAPEAPIAPSAVAARPWVAGWSAAGVCCGLGAGSRVSRQYILTGQAQILKAEQIHKALTASEYLSFASSLLIASGEQLQKQTSPSSAQNSREGRCCPGISVLCSSLGCNEKSEVMAPLVTPAPTRLATPSVPPEVLGLPSVRRQTGTGFCQASSGHWEGWPGEGARCHPGRHNALLSGDVQSRVQNGPAAKQEVVNLS